MATTWDDPFGMAEFDPGAIPPLPAATAPSEDLWSGLDIPSAPVPTAAPMVAGVELAPAWEIPQAPAPGPIVAPAMVPEAQAVAMPGVPSAPEQVAPAVPAMREMLRPTREQVAQAIAVPKGVAPEQRAPVAAGQQAQVMAESVASAAERQADYMRQFSDRLRAQNERDDMARAEVQQNLERIDERLRADQDEVRALTRQAASGELSGPARGALLVGAALQTIKALVGAGPANAQVVQQVIERDAQSKARALQMARERAGISEEQRADELGRLQEQEYLRQVATTTTWEQIEAELRADAAATQDTVRKVELETAAERAGAAARKSREDAAKAAYMWELDAAKKRAEIAEAAAKTRKTEAEAAREERRGLGGGKKAKGLTVSVESQLRGLDKEERERIEDRGIRGPTGEFLRSPDGSFALARSREAGEKLSAEYASVMTVNDYLQRLESLRREYGHEWKLSNSAALQDMQSTMGELQLKLKDVYQLGVLSDSDLEMLKDITGGNPAGWFDKRPTWAAMRSRLEGAFSRRLRQGGGYKGEFKLPKDTGKARSLEQISTTIDRPYDPVSGKVLPVETRLAALEEERMRLATAQGEESQRETAERLGLPLATGPAGLSVATEASIERMESRINEQHRELLARIEADREAAREKGDTDKVRQLTESRNAQVEFAAEANKWLAKQRAKLRRDTSGDAARAKQATERYESGAAPAGAKPGAF